MIMQQAKSHGNASKKASSSHRVRSLVRLSRRDLGLGAAGLAAVRALVVSGEEVRQAVEGEGGGSRFARGGDGAMGLGRRNLA